MIRKQRKVQNQVENKVHLVKASSSESHGSAPPIPTVDYFFCVYGPLDSVCVCCVSSRSTMTWPRLWLSTVIKRGSWKGISIRITRNNHRRMASTLTTQNFTIPHVAELYDPKFLDVLLPASDAAEEAMLVDAPVPRNAMMDALQQTSHLTYTANGAPALDSTLSPTVDAFSGLNSYSDATTLDKLLRASWKSDPALTLRLIYQLRSIHDGKAEKEGFYR